LKIDRCTFFFLPGVPREMQDMLADSVLPYLKRLRGNAQELTSVTHITTFGLTEAATGEQLTGFQQHFAGTRLGMRTVFPEIHLRLSAREENLSMLQRGMQDAVRWIQQQLGDKILSTEGKGMQEIVGDLLRHEKATIAVAESCTGGLIAHLLTNVSGSSDYFMLAGVTYSNAAKIRILGVSETTLRHNGAVHEETAREMAEGVRRVSGAAYGLATTGIAGPTGGTAKKPVGTVCIGLAGADGAFGKRFYFPFDNRAMNKRIFAITALDLLRRKLMQPTA
jgi:nicotinamide-nucleotide amidase